MHFFVLKKLLDGHQARHVRDALWMFSLAPMVDVMDTMSLCQGKVLNQRRFSGSVSLRQPGSMTFRPVTPS